MELITTILGETSVKNECYLFLSYIYIYIYGAGESIKIKVHANSQSPASESNNVIFKTTRFLFVSNTFISNARLKLAKK